MHDWLARVTASVVAGQAMVRVVIVATRGSAPREAGACMLIDKASVQGTIGGGHLEWQATTLARAMLEGGDTQRRDHLRSFTLGATLGQCCGGVVDLWFERFDAADQAFLATALATGPACPWLLTAMEPSPAISTTANTLTHRRKLVGASDPVAAGLHLTTHLTPHHATRQTIDGTTWYVERLGSPLPHVWLFGAGHVGYALAQVLGTLPVALTWIDSRPGLLPAPGAWPHTLHGAPLVTLETDDPASEVAHAPAGTHFLIMTHSHDLDLELCRAILRRDNESAGGLMGLIGLIGSRTKAARFRHRLNAQGLAAERITCPLGLADIRAKHPGAVALSIAAHLQAHLELVAQGNASAPAITDLQRPKSLAEAQA